LGGVFLDASQGLGNAAAALRLDALGDFGVDFVLVDPLGEVLILAPVHVFWRVCCSLARYIRIGITLHTVKQNLLDALIGHGMAPLW